MEEFRPQNEKKNTTIHEKERNRKQSVKELNESEFCICSCIQRELFVVVVGVCVCRSDCFYGKNIIITILWLCLKKQRKIALATEKEKERVLQIFFLCHFLCE